MALLLGTVPAAAQPGDDPGGGRSPVELDRLLELPSSLDYGVERRGGRTAGEWRARFREIREELAAERAALEDAESRLVELADRTEPWKVAPALPGVGAAGGDAPLDYGLRQEIRRHREEVARLERRLRELEIEADLAGVPAAWREGRSGEGGAPGRDAPTDRPPPRIP